MMPFEDGLVPHLLSKLQPNVCRQHWYLYTGVALVLGGTLAD